jgi:hypothetical protein
MSQTFQRVAQLVAQDEVRISAHGYEELEEDGLLASEVLSSVSAGVVVEDYPDYHKGPAVLVLQRDHQGTPIHVLWGIPRGATTPAVLVTAYRPDTSRWSEDFTRRIE